MTVFYIDCPTCSETGCVEVGADVDLGLVHPVSDLEAMCCSECHADPTDCMARDEFAQILITKCKEMADDC